MCLLEQRIHSRLPGTFDLGLHRELKDESSTFDLGEFVIEQPEVVVASELKTAAESAVMQACTLVIGLLHDCQIFISREKEKKKRRLCQQPIQEDTAIHLFKILWMKHRSVGLDQNRCGV